MKKERPHMGALKHFDPDALTEVIQLQTEGENGLLQSLVQDYGNNFPVILKTLKTAVENKNFEAVAMQAHSLKSSSNLLGLYALGSVCADIEHEANKKIIDEKKQALIENEFAMAYPELAKFSKVKYPAN